ncbi:hypothetical protein [Paenibacillus sp. BIHB 4019]|uniref:hypothetical protein n=1 Tax=Paenibacillus sp. BIHB 4019 TaxID=1870819 RepID=UPI001C0F32E5|nr:hypothetical protein [Paenibacillus sp. BIHB 4019]
MAGGIYIEEKGKYKIDCTSALWATDEIHTDYHSLGLSILCDADFVAETQDHIYLIEYKNANIPEAIAHNSTFNPAESKYIDKVARKFYDSLHYLAAKGKRKPVKYIYIVEYPNAGTTDRKMLRNKIATSLPFALQKGQANVLIDDFQVVSIEEWNESEEYSQFPLTPVQRGAAT